MGWQCTNPWPQEVVALYPYMVFGWPHAILIHLWWWHAATHLAGVGQATPNLKGWLLIFLFNFIYLFIFKKIILKF
jgi:hypothetical protein